MALFNFNNPFNQAFAQALGRGGGPVSYSYDPDKGGYSYSSGYATPPPNPVTSFLNREALLYGNNLDAASRRYAADTQLQGNLAGAYWPSLAGVEQAKLASGAQRYGSLADLVGTLGKAKSDKESILGRSRIEGGTERYKADKSSLASILASLIPAQSAERIVPQQLRSQERIAGGQQATDRYGVNRQAQASEYGAGASSLANVMAALLGRQGVERQAGASEFGAREGRLASEYGAKAGLEGILRQVLGQERIAGGQQATERYGAELGLQGVGRQAQAQEFGAREQAGASRYGSDTALAAALRQALAQENIARGEQGTQRYGAELGLEGTRATADANRFGSQKAAEASILGALAQLEAQREVERGRGGRFDKSLALFDRLLPFFTGRPQAFQGYQFS